MPSDFDKALDFLNSSRDENPKVREGYVKSPFGWPGGKSKSIDHLIPLIPIRGRYVEHCGGSGAHLLARDESDLEVFNDRFSGVTDFYRVIKDAVMKERFLELLQPFIHSREMFGWCKETWENTADPVERAFKWYYMVNVSFAAQGRNFGRTTSGKNIIAMKMENRIPLITAVSKRLARVQIENQDMFQCMHDFDDHDTVHYFDPPYVKYAGGIYHYEMKKEQHYQLCNEIMKMKGFVALSGYANPIYDSFEWTERHEWEVVVSGNAHAFTEENNRVDTGQGKSKATEVLWIKEAE